MTAGTSVASELGIYVCPACKRLLRQEEGVLRCPTCSQAYPIREGIPDFIREELSQSKDLVRVREWYSRDQGLHVFDLPQMEQYLTASGFKDFQPEVSGSILTFSARKQAA